MFLEVVGIGGLDLQLIYFRGMRGVNAECKASPWISDPVVLARMMAKIRCETGYTQIGKVLQHVSREAHSARSAPWSMSEMPAKSIRDADRARQRARRPQASPCSCSRKVTIRRPRFASGRSRSGRTGPITALTRAAPSFWASFSRPLQRLLSEASWRWNGRIRMRQRDCSVRSANQPLSMVRQSKHEGRPVCPSRLKGENSP